MIFKKLGGGTQLGNVQISYDASEWEGVCSNCQSAIIWGREVRPNHQITFIVTEKAYGTVPLALFTVYVGEGAG